MALQAFNRSLTPERDVASPNPHISTIQNDETPTSSNHLSSPTPLPAPHTATATATPTTPENPAPPTNPSIPPSPSPSLSSSSSTSSTTSSQISTPLSNPSSDSNSDPSFLPPSRTARLNPAKPTRLSSTSKAAERKKAHDKTSGGKGGEGGKRKWTLDREDWSLILGAERDGGVSREKEKEKGKGKKRRMRG